MPKLKDVDSRAASERLGFGIVLIAIEQPFYGHLAYNMALSLKLDDPNVPILLLGDDAALGGLSERQREVFDQRVVPNPAHYRVDGRINPYLLKTCLYDYSPFGTTLYLDVDGVFFNDYRALQELRDDLAGCPFQIQEEFRYRSADRGRAVQYAWADLGMIWTAYGLAADSAFIDYNSSFIWFEKSDSNHRYFETVKEIYRQPRIAVSRIGLFMPDEIAFSLASVILGHEGCLPGYRPIFLQNYSERHPRRPSEITFQEFTSDEEVREIVRHHYFLGLPAIPPTRSVIAFYNFLVQRNSRRAGEGDGFTYDLRQKLVFAMRGEFQEPPASRSDEPPTDHPSLPGGVQRRARRRPAI